jgi:hypothetical protein
MEGFFDEKTEVKAFGTEQERYHPFGGWYRYTRCYFTKFLPKSQKSQKKYRKNTDICTKNQLK